MPIAYLGRTFKVPPRNALKQWRKVELLWRSGWLAIGWRTDAYSYMPNQRTWREALNWAKQSKLRN